jgi:hypothetical protein
MIYIENKRRKMERIQAQYPLADILDITSTSAKYAQILSPFYPHGRTYPIPIPFSPGYFAMCVEGVWQGLKVFENSGIDMNTFRNDTMIGLKRTVRKFGIPLGHQKGINSTELLNYFDARMQIYIPTYKWVLENVPEVHNLLQRIADRAKNHDIVFLDYNTNSDFRDTSSPMSHAGLVKLYIEGNYPNEEEHYTPLTAEEIKAKKTAKGVSTPNKRENNIKQPSLF